MITDQNGNTTIITQEKETILALINKIDVLYPKVQNNNIIIILSTLNHLTVDDIIGFSNLSSSHKTAKQSLVIVTNNINFNKVPDHIIIVPTLEEAYDIIEMEDMERDLGL